MSSIIARKRTQPKTKRVCSECDTTTSYDNWRKDDKGGWLCKKCYMKFYFRERPSYFGYKGKVFWDKEQRRLRSGICALCGAKSGDINPDTGRRVQTHRAHVEYHDDDPLKDVVELCSACHRKYDHGIPADRTCCICGSNTTHMGSDGGRQAPYAH
jgi:hypothetical protein